MVPLVITLFLLMATTRCQNIFSQNFGGDLTYYGPQGDQASGNCKFGVTGGSTLPWATGLSGAQFVALDRELYYNAQGAAAQCGLCIALYGYPSNEACTTCGTSPVPSTVQYVMVSNQCPECKLGDLDLAQNGDGRFKGNWHAVQCQVGDSSFVYGWEGSNAYFVKQFVTNSRVPVASMFIRPAGDDSFAEMMKTSDNAFLLNSGTPIQFPADLMLTSVLGDTVMDTVGATNLAGPPVVGTAQFPHHNELECTGASPNTTMPPACGSFCASPYQNQPLPVRTSGGAQSAFDLTNITTSRGDNCSQAILTHGQCGGNQGLCVTGGDRSRCIDGPWPGSCCPSGHSCVRKSPAFYSCEENPVTESADFTPPYQQCGGTTMCNNGTAATSGLPVCFDGIWANYACQPGFTCTRFSSGYWECNSVYPQLTGGAVQSADSQTAAQAAICSGG